ncbi:MAG TPA: M28 family peptidase [Longimicrobiales bacterium]|nr:M28 family peptidase [Longimicrobiales bacterium]
MTHRIAPAALAALASVALHPAALDGQVRPQVPQRMAVFQQLARSTFDGERAREVVAYVDRHFRLPGNQGFDASIMRVVEELEAAGYRSEASASGSPLTYRIERRPLDEPTWDVTSGSVRIVGDGAPLVRLETNRNLVAINSYATPPGGVEAEVVDVGHGAEADFAGKEVRGKIVFGEMRVGRLFTEAVVKRGALGVVAYAIPALNRPEQHRNVIAYASIPQEAQARSWGVQLTTDARDRLREALRAGPLRMRVEVDAHVFESEELTLVADVRGASHPDERFVLSAHVQEAGANDNASGVAALSEIARVFAEGVATGTFVPERTLSWGMSLDMVGEDTDRTGGTFLIEKVPDPSAVWTRGADAHTEWGGDPLTVEQLTPHYLNDFVLNRCLDQGAEDGWVVKTNPFEGGSDHVPFLRAGIPGLLLWHFTDVFYHTDGDRIGNVSVRTLKNVGVCAAVSAMTLTTADPRVARFLVGEVERAALERLAVEEALGVAALAGGGSPDEEALILETWASWYDGALATMADIEVGGPSEATARRIAEARAAVAEKARGAISRLAR